MKPKTKPRRMVFTAGASIKQAMSDIVEQARLTKTTVVANINDIDVVADSDSSVNDLRRYYDMVRKLIDYMEEHGLDVKQFLTEEPFK